MYQFEDCWDSATLADYPYGHVSGVRIEVEVEDEDGNFSTI